MPTRPASVRVIETIHLAPNSTMHVYINDGLPSTHIDHLWVEQTWDPPSPSTFILSVRLHWHQHHDEYLEVTDGIMNIYHHGAWHTTTPDSGVVIAERGTVHGFESYPGVKATLKERVAPSGDYKVAFFKDLGQEGPPGVWRALRVAYDNDLYPWLSRFKVVDWLVSFRPR